MKVYNFIETVDRLQTRDEASSILMFFERRHLHTSVMKLWIQLVHHCGGCGFCCC